MTDAIEQLKKWEFLRKAPDADARNPDLRNRAKGLKAAARSPLQFVVLCHALARDGIRYVTDTERSGGEDIAGLTRRPTETDAVDALDRGADDCDAKARVFCALCLAGGLAARMVPYWKGVFLKHVSAEVRLNGRWLPVELTLARARLGEVADEVPREKDGRWKTT